jgi:transposase InsO family protein
MLANEKNKRTGRKYPMRLILKVVGYSSAAWYGKCNKIMDNNKKIKPGPKPLITDGELDQLTKEEAVNGIFHSQGYKKITSRLNAYGHKCDKKRVYKSLKRQNLLCMAQKPESNGSARVHDGVIIEEFPNRMWGTDGKRFYTQEDGWCWYFSVIDHCNDEILGWHVAKIGTRFEALEPVKQAVKNVYGSLDKDICKGIGLFLRADHGSQYDSKDFQNERKYLGMEYSPAFVRSPECNGVIERFHRTLQEQVFDICRFKNLAEAREHIGYFIHCYNRHWIIERLGYMTPCQYKEKLILKIA